MRNVAGVGGVESAIILITVNERNGVNNFDNIHPVM
jgi:hypothetical protein